MVNWGFGRRLVLLFSSMSRDFATDPLNLRMDLLIYYTDISQTLSKEIVDAAQSNGAGVEPTTPEFRGSRTFYVCKRLGHVKVRKKENARS